MEQATNFLLDFDRGMQGDWDTARAFNDSNKHYTNMLL